MKKMSFKRIIALVLSLIMVIVMLPISANAQSSVKHTVQNNGVIYDLPSHPETIKNYVLLQNTNSKDVVLLEGVDGGYFGSDTKNILNYDFSYKTTNFNIYVSTFEGTSYSYWIATDGTPSFSLSGYEILYKSKDMYPISPYWETGHIFTTLPEGVTWDDQIIISYSNRGYKLYKPESNFGMWVDASNRDCDFFYRTALTSENQKVSRYTYNTTTRTWTKGTAERTEGLSYEIFYVGSDVFLTDGTIKRAGQRDFYAQSSKSQDDNVIYDLSSLLTSDRYILLKNSISQLLVLLIGEDEGYFGISVNTLWNYDSSYEIADFTASYISSFDGKEYGGWQSTNLGNSFSLSEYEILYKSKDIYPVSPSWKTGHIFTTLPEGVTWDDKIIISYSNGGYKLYKPENNFGMWVDVSNRNCDFVYRSTLTAENQKVSRYTYNTTTRTWTSGTFERTEGCDYEIFYVGSDVFSTDGTIKRAGQRKVYAQSSNLSGLQFEPLETSKAKELLRFIANVSDFNIEEELPECYALLTGAIQDPQEELNAKVRFLSYFYYCLDMQLSQSSKRIELGTTYLIEWVEEEAEATSIIIDEIKDELWEDLKGTIAKNIDIPKMSVGYDIATSIIDYGEVLVNAIGTILEIQRVDDINYLRAYLELLKAEYEGNKYMVLYWEWICDSMINDNAFGGNVQEMREYAGYIFNIEHSLSY